MSALEVHRALGNAGDWTSLLSLSSFVPGCGECEIGGLRAGDVYNSTKSASYPQPVIKPALLDISCGKGLGEESSALSFLLGGGSAHADQLPRNRTFLEIGANNGVHSNTRALEHCLGWRGLLIEGHPANFRTLRQTRPNSLTLGSAACESHGFAQFYQNPGVTAGAPETMPSALRNRFHRGHVHHSTISVPCGPLSAWFQLLRFSHVDYFSLDVEGAEALVLSTVDWSKFTVCVLIAECRGGGCKTSQDADLHRFLVGWGLERVATLRARHDIWDAVYVNRSLLPSFPLVT